LLAKTQSCHDIAASVITRKIVPIGDGGHLLTLTLTSDDLESHIVVNVSSTSNIIPRYQVLIRSDEVDFLANFEVT